MGLYENFKGLCIKDTANGAKRQSRKWEKLSENHVFDKGLYRKLLKLNKNLI